MKLLYSLPHKISRLEFEKLLFYIAKLSLDKKIRYYISRYFILVT